MSVEKAITKINTEIEENQNKNIGMMIRTVGEFLKEYLERDPSAAEEILVEDKTIAKSIEAMRKVALKNGGVLSDPEGFEIALKYYEIEPVEASEADYSQIPAEEEFSVKLDDFL